LAKLQKVEPRNPLCIVWQGAINLYRGNFNDAEESFRKVVNQPAIGLMLVLCFVLQKAEAKAIIEANKLYDPENKDYWNVMIRIYWTALDHDRQTMANLVTDDLIIWAWRDFQYAHLMAVAFALAKNQSETFKWLDRAISRGFVNYPFLLNFCPAMKLMETTGQHMKLLERAKAEFERYDDFELG